MVSLNLYQWLRSIWSESDGTGSNSRLIQTLSTVSALVLVYLVTLTNRDIPSGAQVILLTAMGVSVGGYAINKVVSSRTSSAASRVTDSVGEKTPPYVSPSEPLPQPSEKEDT